MNTKARPNTGFLFLPAEREKYNYRSKICFAEGK